MERSHRHELPSGLAYAKIYACTGSDLATKQIKRLRKLVPPFAAVPPIWQLRVGDYRVFYDVDETENRVFIRAVRRKPPHRTTEEIL